MTMKNKSTLYILSFVGLLALVAVTYLLMDNVAAPAPNENANNDKPTLQYVEYDTKVVYSLKPNVRIDQLESDCNERGGTFNECGSACDPAEETCSTVCAFTCELEAKDTTDDLIRVESPQPESVIANPLVITGEARGNWFFEGEFPVTLTNWDGLIVAEASATADGEWMTENFVPFTATLEFETPEFGDNGFLILRKANPSGLPENDAAKEFQVMFR